MIQLKSRNCLTQFTGKSVVQTGRKGVEKNPARTRELAKKPQLQQKVFLQNVGDIFFSPLKAEGHIITCETITGEVYRGKLIEAEDNMNCQVQNVTVTHRDGRVAQLENIYIRGSKIRFLIIPDMLKNAPMLKGNPPCKLRAPTFSFGWNFLCNKNLL